MATRVLAQQRTRLVIAFVSLVVGSAAFPPAAGAAGVAVRLIHVTQGTQTFNHTIPLIAHRSTAVRVAVSSEEEGTVPQDVTGELHIFVDGQRITPEAGLTPINDPFTGRTDLGTFNEEGDTLDFELPFSVQNRLEPKASSDDFPRYEKTNDVRFQVHVSAPGADANQSNNTGEVAGLRLRRLPPVTVHFATATVPGPASIPDAAPQGPNPNMFQPGRGDAYLSSAVPFDNSCAGCLYRRGMGDFPLPDVGSAIDTGEEPDAVLDHLEGLRPMIVNDGFGPLLTQILYAWVPQAVLPAVGGELEGATRLGGSVAFGTDRLAKGQAVLAHEILHDFGVVGPTAQGIPRFGVPAHWIVPRTVFPGLGWDVGKRLENNPGPLAGQPDTSNGVVGHVRPPELPDIMNQVQVFRAGDQWSGPDTIRDLLNEGEPRQCCRALDLDLYRDDLPARRRCLPGHGTFSLRIRLPSIAPTALARAVALRGVTYDWCTGSEFARPAKARKGATAAASPEERFEARILVRRRRGTRTVSRSFSALTIVNRHHLSPDKQDDHAGDAQLGSEELSIPLRPGERVERVSVIDNEYKRRYPALVRSRFAPEIRIKSPRAKSRLGGTTTLDWTVRDRDTRSSRLRYQVAYSPDGGNDFVPIAADLRATKLKVNYRQLPRTRSGRGLFRIFANDGLNTTSVDIRNLSLSRAGWVLENPRPPS
jgi:hypothetical protein